MSLCVRFCIIAHKYHRFTCMRAQMSSQGISTATSIVASGTFERLLSRMQLDVAQQVPLLGEGSPTLVTLKRPLTYEHMVGPRILEGNKSIAFILKLTFRLVTHFVHKMHLYLLAYAVLCRLILTCVTSLVNHQHIGSDADHPTNLTLELPIGEPDRTRRGSFWTGHLSVNARSVSSSSGKLGVPFFHGFPSVIPPAIIPHSLPVLWLWSTWWLIITAQLNLDGVCCFAERKHIYLHI